MIKESRSEADFEKEADLLALANAAYGQRENPVEPLDGHSETGFSRKMERKPNHFYKWGLRVQPRPVLVLLLSLLEIGDGDCTQVPLQPFVERNFVKLPEPSSEGR